MLFAIDSEHLPATLTSHPMSDDEFAKFCSDHPDLFFEMSADGELVIMAPTFSQTGSRSLRIGRMLDEWAESDGRGIACDSSTGFVLPNGARRSPDASWTLRSRIEQLDDASRQKFWHLCPDFVIELKSSSDRSRTLHGRMLEYLENGAKLGWLIDPDTRTITIYRPNQQTELITNPTAITADGPVAGFTLNLARIWDPLQ